MVNSAARSHIRPYKGSHGRKRIIKIDGDESKVLLEPQIMRSLSIFKALLQR
jgi:hypothetical protein